MTPAEFSGWIDIGKDRMEPAWMTELADFEAPAPKAAMEPLPESVHWFAQA